MAIDNTPPRLKLIATIAVITVITLIGINFVTEGYYAMMTDEAKREKLGPTADRDEQHKAEAVAFTSAAMPIDQAMAAIAKGTRPELITPQASEDLGPMTGWSKLPKAAPIPQLHPAEPLVPVIMGDGGAELAGDAGTAVPTAAGDAGASHAVPATDAGAAHAVPAADAGASHAVSAADAGAPAPAPRH